MYMTFAPKSLALHFVVETYDEARMLAINLSAALNRKFYVAIYDCGDYLRIAVFNNGECTAYFDDIHMRVLEENY